VIFINCNAKILLLLELKGEIFLAVNKGLSMKKFLAYNGNAVYKLGMK